MIRHLPPITPLLKKEGLNVVVWKRASSNFVVSNRACSKRVGSKREAYRSSLYNL